MFDSKNECEEQCTRVCTNVEFEAKKSSAKILNGTASNTSSNDDDCECVTDNKAPCESLNKLVSNSITNAKIKELKDKTNLKKESGYKQDNNGKLDALKESKNGHSLDFRDLSINTVGYLHTHLNDFINDKGKYQEIFRIFSPGDIVQFFRLLDNINSGRTAIELSSVYGGVITSSGSYFFKFTGDKSKIKSDLTRLKSNYAALNKTYAEVIKKSNLEKGLLKFLKEEIKIDGLRLFKLQNNNIGRIKISELGLSSNEKKVIKSECE